MPGVVGVLGDVCRAIEARIAPFCDKIMSVLLTNLQSNDVQRNIKPQILSAFGDIAIAIGDRVRGLPAACAADAAERAGAPPPGTPRVQGRGARLLLSHGDAVCRHAPDSNTGLHAIRMLLSTAAGDLTWPWYLLCVNALPILAEL